VSERPESSRVGEIVGGKYRVVRFLAKGGMGVVYEAQHLVVRRRFAVKFLHRELAERREILTRFQREAEAAGALESEHVIAAVDFGIVDDGTPYIVMEFLIGESLAALIAREQRVPAGRAADLVAQACRGIQAAHASGIVHRDLKPHNLFVCRREDGTDLVKVLDFGVAKLQAFDESKTATRSGAVLGTVAYMSPEQARGDKEIDHRADVYALGAILYELLSGQRPHAGESPNAILHHICTQPALSLDAAKLELPAGLAELVTRALSADPQARQQSAEALGAALAPFGKREVWPAPPAQQNEDVARKTGETPARVVTAPSSAAVASDRVRPPSRRGVVAVGAVGAVLVSAAIAVVAASGRGDDKVPPAPTASSPTVVQPAPRPAEPPVVTPTAAAPVSQGQRAREPGPLPAARPAPRPVARPIEPHTDAPAAAPSPPSPTAEPSKADPIAPKFDPQNPYE
jgi:eukaryotic-like serine/threonine-protein kinase